MGQPHAYAHRRVSEYLDEIRTRLFESKQMQAEKLPMEKFMITPLRQKAYQPFGDVYLEFSNHEDFSDYYRGLDFRWENKKLIQLTVKSNAGEKCRLN